MKTELINDWKYRFHKQLVTVQVSILVKSKSKKRILRFVAGLLSLAYLLF